jgi:hypothetical protein
MQVTSNGRERRKNLSRAEMVGWFDLKQLFTTAGDVVISTVLGRHADRRSLEPFAAKDVPIYDHSKIKNGSRSVTIDYISDTGDGWNSTYAVLYWATQQKLQLSGIDTTRGDILVLGGDESYPVGNRQTYDQRLLKPMEAAMGQTESPSPYVYAVPGNHDWYDSLISFTRLFISRLWIAGWQTQQDRSYFALKLPDGWWLVATDVGLESDIDDAQLKFLQMVARIVPEEDRIILCNAEPFWVKAQDYQKNDSNLRLIEKLLGTRIRVFLAGDLHHYRRHESPDGRQKITAGGGGAFLHPTHGWSKEPLPDGFKLVTQASFPPEAESRKLTKGNILFFLKNKTFGIATSILYTLTAWSFMANIGTYSMTPQNLPTVLHEVVNRGLQNSTAAFWVVLIFLGFYFFTETTSTKYRIIGGSLHAVAHLTACFVLGWLGGIVAVALQATFGEPLYQIYSGAVLLVGGYVVGSILMGLYLYISLNIFKRHRNEAFSALKVEDWKHFLRIIIKDGRLTILPIGIQRVPKHWKPANAQDPHEPQFVPDDATSTAPNLIEQPIIVFK